MGSTRSLRQRMGETYCNNRILRDNSFYKNTKLSYSSLMFLRLHSPLPSHTICEEFAGKGRMDNLIIKAAITAFIAALQIVFILIECKERAISLWLATICLS